MPRTFKAYGASKLRAGIESNIEIMQYLADRIDHLPGFVRLAPFRCRWCASSTGRPSCLTTSGRTVYGGGGIFPDVVAEPSPGEPRWMSLVEERGITLDWVGAFVSGNPMLFASLDAFARTRSLPASAIESFRAFAAERGVTIPAGPDSDNVLQPYLLRVAASTKWGDEGGYLMTARLDPEIQRALTLLPQAAALAATVR